jgi:transcriptional regulator with XRE-family HTH domain
MMPQNWGDSFGGRLTQLRHEHRLTQEQLADRSGLSTRAISSLECGARHPRRLTVERLALGLGLTLSERRQLVDAATAERWHRVEVLAPPQAPLLPLAGRDRELAELRAHVRGDGPPLLCYVGEPGIGKSRLLTEARHLAANGGVPALTGACQRGNDPHAPIVDALARHARLLPRTALLALVRNEPGLLALLPELAALVPDGGIPRPAAEHHRRLVFDAALRLLEDAARGTGRVVLLLDDLQWAEPAAADLLAHLVTRMGPRLRAVGAVRAGELPSRLGQCIADLARIGLVGHRTLNPLTDTDALNLVARRDVVRRAGGLPLFLTELAGSTDGIPDHLRVVVRQQLADLPDDTRAPLQRIAAGPAVAPIERLVRSGDDPQRVLTTLEPAIRRHILDDTALGFRFRYPLFREVLAADIGPTRRRLLRHAVALVGATRHLSRTTFG